MNTKIKGWILVAILILAPAMVWGKVRVVSSITDLGSIAAYVGGDRVEVVSVARGNDDPHRIEVLPSHMLKAAKADIFLKVGMSLDRWADYIIDGSHNSKLKIIDCSKGVHVLEKPTTMVTAAQGDIHPEGNPHYWLDPENGAIIAQTIADALAGIDPEGADDFKAAAERFATEVEAKNVEWHKRLSQAAETPVITYHNSWPNLAGAFGLNVIGFVEPYPGVPPSGAHLKMLVERIKSRGVKVLIQEPFFSDDAGEFLKRETGVKILKFQPSCAGVKPTDYLGHFEQLVVELERVG